MRVRTTDGRCMHRTKMYPTNREEDWSHSVKLSCDLGVTLRAMSNSGVGCTGWRPEPHWEETTQSIMRDELSGEGE